MTSKIAILVLVGLSAVNGLGFSGSAPGWRVALAVIVVAPAYLSGRRLAGRRDGLVLAVATAVTAASAVVTEWRAATATLCVAIFVALPWLIGRSRQQSARLVDAERGRADQLEREQRLVAERARLAERARIAADMHDSLGHSLALIALRAGSLELAPGLSDEHRLAAERLRTDAVSATDELRHTIALLRSPDRAAQTHPPDEDVAALVERAVEAGMTVNLRHDGTEAARPTLVGRAVYRVVQESLTNAARYAPGAQVEVVVDDAADATGVSVTNGPPGDAPLALTGTGQGLAGLRERVELLGGTFAAAPHADGFRVEARLPHDAPPSTPPPTATNGVTP